MIEVRVALLVEPLPDQAPVARHFIIPCRCAVHLSEPGETCARCGRYALAALIEAAVSWYPPHVEDPVLRSLRTDERDVAA